MQYRPDIDGLRAIAVSIVVLNHAGFSLFSGGFIGVDIFFVISGYLITHIIVTELQEKRFSFIEFYERRARRILPALCAMCMVSIIVAYFFLLPKDLSTMAESLLATLGFASNFYFLYETEGYFAGNSELMPLLHTWSLAIEEQFYVVAPLLFLVIVKYVPSYLKYALWCLTITSFFISFVLLTFSLQSTFYLPFGRIWELSIGSLAAIGAIRLSKRMWVREIMAIAGATMIFYSLFTLTSSHIFPSYNALLPCIGTLLIILAGQDNTSTYVGRILAIKPVIFIGLISYSLYLWHAPLLTFMKYYFVHEFSTIQASIAIIISILLATLSWHYIEKPFRNKARTSRRTIFTTSASTIALLALLAGATLWKQGFPERFDDNTLPLAHFNAPVSPRGWACVKHTSTELHEKNCVLGNQNAQPTIAIWGDSHSATMVTAFDDWGKNTNHTIQFYGRSGCFPLVTTSNYSKRGPDENCGGLNNTIFDKLTKSKHINTVVLMSRWSNALNTKAWSLGPDNNRHRPTAITSSDPIKNSGKTFYDIFAIGTQKTVQGLIDAGKTVILVYPIPETGYHIPSSLSRWYTLHDRAPANSFYVKRTDYDYINEEVFTIFNELPDHPQLKRLYPHKKFCDSSKCTVYENGKILYYDDDHLSIFGADFIMPAFVELLEP